MSSHLEGDQLRFLRWNLKRLPARQLAEKLRIRANRYAQDDVLHHELLSITDETIQRWETNQEPIPHQLRPILLNILGFPKELLSEGFIRYCQREALPQSSALHLGRMALKRGEFRGDRDEGAWPAIAEAVLGPGFIKASQMTLLGEFICHNCGLYDPDQAYLVCPECGF